MTTADDSPPLPEGRSPTAPDGTVSSFRKRRGRLLARTLVGLAERLGRPVSVLDVGGRRDYWRNVGFEGVGRITLVNYDPADLNRGADPDGRFVDELGDARALAGIGDGQFDFYHSNSVIEHVGGWDDMAAMAREARRVAPRGWVQTPAWEFPAERIRGVSRARHGSRPILANFLGLHFRWSSVPATQSCAVCDRRRNRSHFPPVIP